MNCSLDKPKFNGKPSKDVTNGTHSKGLRTNNTLWIWTTNWSNNSQKITNSWFIFYLLLLPIKLHLTELIIFTVWFKYRETVLHIRSVGWGRSDDLFIYTQLLSDELHNCLWSDQAELLAVRRVYQLLYKIPMFLHHHVTTAHTFGFEWSNK